MYTLSVVSTKNRAEKQNKLKAINEYIVVMSGKSVVGQLNKLAINHFNFTAHKP